MKIVEVIWNDSKGVTSGWEPKDELEQLKPVHINSVGYLLEDREDYVTILQSDSADEVVGRMTIPKGCIRDMNVIREG
jgi:hypothetical protein